MYLVTAPRCLINTGSAVTFNRLFVFVSLSSLLINGHIITYKLIEVPTNPYTAPTVCAVHFSEVCPI